MCFLQYYCKVFVFLTKFLQYHCFFLLKSWKFLQNICKNISSCKINQMIFFSTRDISKIMRKKLLLKRCVGTRKRLFERQQSKIFRPFIEKIYPKKNNRSKCSSRYVECNSDNTSWSFSLKMRWKFLAQIDPLGTQNGVPTKPAISFLFDKIIVKSGIYRDFRLNPQNLKTWKFIIF